jgi:hypothetical protein
MMIAIFWIRPHLLLLEHENPLAVRNSTCTYLKALIQKRYQEYPFAAFSESLRLVFAVDSFEVFSSPGRNDGANPIEVSPILHLPCPRRLMLEV